MDGVRGNQGMNSGNLGDASGWSQRESGNAELRRPEIWMESEGISLCPCCMALSRAGAFSWMSETLALISSLLPPSPSPQQTSVRIQMEGSWTWLGSGISDRQEGSLCFPRDLHWVWQRLGGSAFCNSLTPTSGSLEFHLPAKLTASSLPSIFSSCGWLSHSIEHDYFINIHQWAQETWGGKHRTCGVLTLRMRKVIHSKFCHKQWDNFTWSKVNNELQDASEVPQWESRLSLWPHRSHLLFIPLISQHSSLFSLSLESNQCFECSSKLYESVQIMFPFVPLIGF